MTLALKYALGVLLTATLSGQALACYTVYNRANQVIYHARQAPVDMRYQLHQTLPTVFKDGHMVFSITDSNCPAVNLTRSNIRDSAGGNMVYVVDQGPARSRPFRDPRN
ncbi:hypothetical protein [Polaromonas eurypsychrophila]|uniref:Uncharacterized protein n=1 Tax=Polaromonas eurypsychrophila TaxID=1614635 RepID=A0A916WCL1_9BURK|nr:hypothetical protein [Polaromonas eurypsychrophila]GGA86523.1 hypothetical protein GCM10011496_03920 [Polaromonas eurypsychrophila]